MDGNRIDWAALARMPKFVELHTKRRAFLLTLWCFGSLCFYLLPICAGYFPELMRTRLLGRLNVGYFLCLLEFGVIWGIALYYTRKSNAVFDPLTREVVEEIRREVAR